MKYRSHTLEARDLLVMRDNRCLLAHVNCAVASGGLLRLTGANGVGKSSLLRALCGLNPATAGKLLLDQCPCRNYHLTPCLFHYVGHAIGVSELLTPLDTLTLWTSYYCLPTNAQALRALLDDASLAHCERVQNNTLSNGQKKRLALLRLQLAPRPFWFLDEVHTALDAEACSYISQQINVHLANGGAVVMISHQILPDLSATNTLDVGSFAINS